MNLNNHETIHPFKNKTFFTFCAASLTPMLSLQFLTLMVSNLFVSAIPIGLVFIKRPTLPSLVNTIAVNLALVFSLMTAASQMPDSNYLNYLLSLSSGADKWMLLAMILGGLMATPWWILAMRPGSNSDRAAFWTLRESGRFMPVLLAASIMGILWIRETHADWINGPPVTDRRFQMDEVGILLDEPIVIAVTPDERVFVSYDHIVDGYELGGIDSFQFREDLHSWEQSTVARGPLLCRPFGLAWRNRELFVSRSGRFPSAKHGVVSYSDVGAVTQLSDADKDGYFEYAHDILSGLPGCRGPDTQHSNNSLAFGNDGSLFLAVGSPHNRLFADHQWEGKILRIAPDFSTVAPFAEGFRNPFGMVVDQQGELFVTDNDVASNPGDEINLVKENGHYGHPYVIPDDGQQTNGFDSPIYIGPRNAVITGLAYTNSESLPVEYRDCLYYADPMNNYIMRLSLTRTDQEIKVVSANVFCHVQRPVGVTISPNGTFYVATRKERKIYRVKLRDDSNLTSTDQK